MIDGDSGKYVQQGRPQKIVGTEKGAVKARYKLFPELDFDKPGYTVTLDNQYNVVNGGLAYLITVKGPDGVGVKYFYDQKTGLKVQQYTDVVNATRMGFSDYRDINTGVKLPFTEVSTIAGTPITYKISSATANTNLADDIFK